jgi:anti-sigma-K factor RskA
VTPCRRPDVAELLGSYVLGACSDADAELVRAHVARCASCTDTLAALAPAREGLLADVERAAPPVDLKSRVMGQVRADASLFEAARAPERPQRRLAWLRLPRVAMAVGAAAVVALAVTIAFGGSTDRETIYAGRVDGIAAPGGHGSLTVHDGAATLKVSGLPAAGAGRMYEVWMSDRSGRARPAGVRFSVDRAGTGEVAMPSRPPEGREIMVTSEIGGNATTPTRAPIVRVAT